MVATPIVQSTRYFDVNTTDVYYLPTIAAASLIATRAELNAGTDLTREIADFEGFMVTSEELETPDMASLFTSKIGGRTTADDSSLTFYADDNGVDVRGVLPRNTVGFIVWLDGGDIAGNRMDVYPIRVRSVPKMRSTTEAARLRVDVSITREPAENLVVPA